MKRTLPLLALLVALAGGCSMPNPPAGYEFQCDPGGSCPKGEQCKQGCCVSKGQTPGCGASVPFDGGGGSSSSGSTGGSP